MIVRDCSLVGARVLDSSVGARVLDSSVGAGVFDSSEGALVVSSLGEKEGPVEGVSVASSDGAGDGTTVETE